MGVGRLVRQRLVRAYQRLLRLRELRRIRLRVIGILMGSDRRRLTRLYSLEVSPLLTSCACPPDFKEGVGILGQRAEMDWVRF